MHLGVVDKFHNLQVTLKDMAGLYLCVCPGALYLMVKETILEFRISMRGCHFVFKESSDELT